MSPEMMSDIARGLPDEPILTVSQIAAFMKMSEATVYRRCQAGEIPCAKLKRIVRIPRASFVAWLAQQSGAA
ncbi:hypothetical protein TSA6c_00365 [Azospirillum sp. TSA6c]|uniref:helix-turn-helix domain-containing protein n=1 Tax=Azospirillum sp. TSA6c TaxID=709813 RepID=UPI000D608DDC|nr:helix-turn-helix domain-containing protein [Azospirillum sp. TSA6c]PWC54414.1 hypothetical protein TSA6c_00365 [Azospirillum sp. TSA6c]